MNGAIFKRTGKRAAGFSLIETMVALGVITVSSLGSVALMANSFMFIKDGRKRAEMATVVEETVSSIVSASAIAKKSAHFYRALNSTAVRSGCGACSSTGCPSCTRNNYRGTGLHLTTGSAGLNAKLFPIWIEVEYSFRPGVSRKKLFHLSVTEP